MLNRRFDYFFENVRHVFSRARDAEEAMLLRCSVHSGEPSHWGAAVQLYKDSNVVSMRDSGSPSNVDEVLRRTR